MIIKGYSTCVEHTAQLYDRIVARRQEQADSRESAARNRWLCLTEDSGKKHPALLPLVILELVLEELLVQRHRFESEPAHVFSPSRSLEHALAAKRSILTEYEVTFKAMSLVHSTWTQLSQRALGSSFTVRVGALGKFAGSSITQGFHNIQLRSLLCSPLFGTWTKRAHFKILGPLQSFVMNPNGHFKRTSQANMSTDEALLLGIIALRRYGGLRQLTLVFGPLSRQHAPTMERLLEQVEGLENLQEFTVDVGGSYDLLVKLCCILPALRSLKSLTIIAEGRSWETNGEWQCEEELEHRTPPESLKHVTLSVGGIDSIELQPIFQLVTWLTAPRHTPHTSYKLDSLTIYYHTLTLIVGPDTSLALIDSITPALVHLRTLELHTALTDKTPQENISRTLLERCRVLQRLRICFIDERSPGNFGKDAFKAGPESLEEIEVATKEHWPFSIENERCCRFRVCQNPMRCM